MDMTYLSQRPSELSLRERFLTATWIYAFFFLAYTLANRTVSMDTAVNLTIPLDRLIPFIPEFIFPFYLLYGFIVLPSFLIKKRRLFYRSAAAFTALIIFSAFIFILFPVYVPRPDFVPDSFAGRLVSSVYQMDRPLCGFPSLHVSASLLATLIMLETSRIQGRLFFVMFALTSAATLFIKQHVLLDVAGGIAMALLMNFIFIREERPSMRSLIKAFRLIIMTSAQTRNGGISDKVRRNECVTVNGTRYDLYEPVVSVSGTFIVVHGLTLQGEKDERLINFAEKLALSGIRTAAISLPALTECRFDDADIRAIGDLTAELSGRYGGKVGIIGFSFGAGLALVAATRQATRHLIDPMILFGPYYSLKKVQAETEQLRLIPPVTEDEWNNYIWIRLVTVFQHLDELELEEHTRRQVRDMLTHYCHEPSPAVKRDFYKTTLKQIQLNDSKVASISDSFAKALSPESKLRNIQSRVFLIHDYNDALIPWSHSHAIFLELKNNSVPSGHKLLITPLLSHVTPRTAIKVFDIFTLINIFARIFE